MSALLADLNSSTDYLAIDWAVLTLIILSAFMAIRMRDLLASSVILGIFSLLMALMYLLLDAPDVALTEAAVGAGISTVMFLGALSFTEREHKFAPLRKRIVPLIVVTCIGTALIYSTDELPPFGSPDGAIHQNVAPYYIENTKTDIEIPNMVTAILASYRGFDTMGEVGVIFTAGISITALLMNLPQLRVTTPMQAPINPDAPQPGPQPKQKPKPKAKTATRKAAKPRKKPATKKSPSAKKGGKK